MKIKIFIIAITVVVLAALSAAGFFIYRQMTKTEAGGSVPVTIGGEEPVNPPSGGEEVLKETILIKSDFEITLPPGWQELNNPPEEVLAMVIDAKEDVSGGAFQKLDFRTNLSIKVDDMKRYVNIDDLGAYLESVKTSLTQAVPSIKFTGEEQKTINGSRAILIECESRQEEIDFRTLLAFLEGNDGVVYALSFNAFQSSWASYRDTFYRIAESFKLKYKIEL